jgi:hypothetical protein
MRKLLSIGAMSALVAALCVAQSARADIVTFNDIPNDPGTLYADRHNHLYDGGLHFQERELIVMPVNLDPHPTGQASRFMEAGNYSDVEPITFAAYTGAIDPMSGATNDVAFNLWYLKIGLGDGNLGASDMVTIRGTSAVGCVDHCNPTMQIAVTPHFQLISLKNFTDLLSVTIDQQVVTDSRIVSNIFGDPLVVGGDGTIDGGWLGFDDITYTTFGGPGDLRPDAPSPVPLANVPEPSAWALMILGFGGVGALMRRNRPVSLAVA